MKEKTLVHIGGSALQIPSVEFARKLGLRVIVTDRDDRAPAAGVASELRVIGGDDVSGIVALARELQSACDLVGVYSSNDFGLLAAAHACKSVCLPGCAPEVVARSLNKSAAKSCFRAAGVRTPGGWTIEGDMDPAVLLSELRLPVIVKPVDGSGSRGVATAETANGLLRAVVEARAISSTVLVEEVVEGRHVDVNALFAGGLFIRQGLADREFCALPYHYPIWGAQPAELQPAEVDAVYDSVERGARALGLEEGPAKADVVLTEDGPVVLEITPRFHGDVLSAKVTPIASGESPIHMWFGRLVHGPGFPRPIDAWSRVGGWMGLFPAGRGTLVSIGGVEEAMKIEGVEDIYIRARPGRRLDGHKDNTSLCGFIWASGRSHADLSATLRRARDMIRFETDEAI